MSASNPRQEIESFWVRCALDEDGPTDTFELVVERKHAWVIPLFGAVPDLGALVGVAEVAASRIGVPSHTRARSAV